MMQSMKNNGKCTKSSKIRKIEKDDTKNDTKQKSKLTFNRLHKSYENCDTYTFKQNEVLITVGICCIKFIKIINVSNIL